MQTVTKRTLLWAGVWISFVIAIVCLFQMYGVHEVTITEKQVQDFANRVTDKEFQVRGSAQLLVKTVRIQKIDVQIKENKLFARIETKGSLLANKNFFLTSNAIGSLQYLSGEFFFKPEKIEVQNFTYEGTSPSETVKNVADRYVTNEKTKALLGDAAPKIERWATTVAENAVTHTLENRPVYRLKDDIKGMLVRASLESVTVKEDKIKIVFSLTQLSVSVLVGFVLLVVAIVGAFALLQSPTLGTAVLLVGSLN